MLGLVGDWRVPTFGCLESTLSPLPFLGPVRGCIAMGTEDRDTALLSRSSAAHCMCKIHIIKSVVESD